MSFTKMYLFALLFVGFSGMEIARAETEKGFYADDFGRNCVCDFDSSIDYFPNKLSANHAKGFSVEYKNHYKIITAEHDGEKQVTYAYLCGTEEPKDLPDGAVTVEIPLKNAALTTTTMIPFFEYINQRDSLDILSTFASSIASPCLMKRVEDGKAIAESWSADEHLVKKDVHAVFSDNTAGTLDAIKEMDSDEKPVILPIYGRYEKEVFAVSEWVEYIALFFNREEAAKDIIDNIEKRYTCTSVKAKAIAKVPKVLWLPSVYEGDYSVAYCPNYYCDYITDLGAEIIELAEGEGENMKKTFTHEEMKQKLQNVEVDYFIFPATFGEYWGSVNSTALIEEIHELIGTDVPFYDASKTTNAWFQSRGAEPDIALLDLATILYPGEDFGHEERYFLREVYNPEDKVKTYTSAECKENAPLFTNWKKSGCAGEVVTIPGLDVPAKTCYDDFSVIEGNGANAASISMAAFMSFFAAQALL